MQVAIWKTSPSEEFSDEQPENFRHEKDGPSEPSFACESFDAALPFVRHAGTLGGVLDGEAEAA